MGSVLMALLMLFGSASSSPERIRIEWVYISKDLSWAPPPRDPELPRYANAFAAILVFYPSGEYRAGLFTVGQYPGQEAIFIIPGEGFSIDRGRWVRDSKGSIKIEARIVYEDKVLRVPPGPTPGPVVVARLYLRGKRPGRLAAVLKSDNGEYVPLRRLASLATLANLLQMEQRPVGDAR